MARHALVVPQGYQAQIYDVSQAHNLALSLLAALCPPSPEGGLAVGTTSMAVISKWTLDVCRRALKTCRSFFDTSSSDSDHILSRVLCSGFGAHPIKDSLSKVGPLLDLLVEVLWTFKHYEGNELHNTLDEKIHELLHEDQYPQVVKECKRRLLPLLRACRENDTGENRNDFQVSAPSKSSAFVIDYRTAATIGWDPRLLLQEGTHVHK
jgi:hypothetical protein